MFQPKERSFNKSFSIPLHFKTYFKDLADRGIKGSHVVVESIQATDDYQDYLKRIKESEAK